MCEWSGGCYDSRFSVRAYDQQTGEILLSRTDLSCEFSKGLSAEYEGTVSGGAISGRRRIVGAGSGRVRPTQLIGEWQPFSCSIDGS